MPSASSCFRCVCLIPYFLACVFLFLLGGIERLLRCCLPSSISLDDMELLSSRMRGGLARRLKVSPVCRTIWQATLRVLCPSAIMKESPEFLKYVEEGNKEVNEMKEEITMCNITFQSLRHERLECLKQYSTRTEEFFLKLDQSRRLQNHIDTLKKDAEDRRISSQTRAAAKRTGYHGIVDWAESTSRSRESLLQTTAQVAFVGAGLTYGSIFSASRGNIGLMCYAFALFDCGFITPTVSLAMLKWASSRPKDTLFCSPHIWKLLLNIFTYGSIAAVASAICLLNMTLYLLAFPLDSSGQRTDANLSLDISPTPAGIISLGCLLLAIGMASICAFVHYMSRGWDAFMHDFIGHRPGEESV